MRSAMSMIELVFAIVVMGIAVMSLPFILTLVQNNNAFAMQQEIILAAKAKMGDILTYEWDGNSFDVTASHSFVLDVANGDNELDRVSGQRRKGHINANYRRKFFPNTTNPSDVGEIDKFNGTSYHIPAAVESAGTLDYVFDLNLSNTVTYAQDTGTYSNQTLNDFTFATTHVANTNIKMVTVNVTGGDQNITLRAFVSNIGENTLIPSRAYQ